jgi:hypothetical protein
MNNLKFRRQFLLSPKKCEQLKDWKFETYGIYNLYIHPDCGHTMLDSHSMHLALIGYIIDPIHPGKSNSDILNDIAASDTIDSICRKLYYYGGRFVLLVRQVEEYFVFHDPGGLKSVFYTKSGSDIYAASQPLLFKLLMPLEEGAKYSSYYKSAYVQSTIEHAIPAGTSLYDNVYHLTPNHYLEFSTYNQIRYWPTKVLSKMEFDEAVKEASSLLDKIMIAANRRFKLALPLTAGWDSRSVLSACKSISDDLYFYTLQYRDLTENSRDIRIPQEILSKMGYQHHIIDCRKPIDEDFSNLYVSNTDIPHLYDWGLIAHGMLAEYPSERIAVKGNCAETARCFFYKSGKHKNILSVDDFDFMEGWNGIPFIKEHVSDWLIKIKNAKVNMGYDLLDLFYWELRIGGWQSQSQLEWDIVQETFTPFNNRALLDIILSVDARYRCEPDYLFFKALIGNLWRETLSAPINPKTGMEKVEYAVKKVLKQTGLFEIARKQLRDLKKAKNNKRERKQSKD